MRLIDADALKEDLTRFYDNEVTARKLIDEQPTIQPEPLQPWEVLVAQAVLPQPKRGKWIKTARWGRVYYCDQCRNYLDFDGVNAGRGSTNFCPNCGADMRGEQDG